MRALNMNELAFVGGGLDIFDLGNGYTMALDLQSPPPANTGTAGGATYTLSGGSMVIANPSSPAQPSGVGYVSITGTGNDAAHILSNAMAGLANLVTNMNNAALSVLSSIMSFFSWAYNGIKSMLGVTDGSNMSQP